MKRILSAFLTFAALALGAGPALTSDYDPMNVAQVELIPGWRTEAGTHMAAIRIRLAPGWKTYWRAPGDAGIPPSFTWTGSRNIQAVAFHWPRPHVYDSGGVRTIGYKDELILPMELTPKAAGDIRVKLQMSYGVCRDVCMPMDVRLSATLPGDVQEADPRVIAALAAVPQSGAGADVRCDVEPIADGLRVTARMTLPRVGGDEVTVMESGDRSIWVSEAVTSRAGGVLTATADLVPPNAQPFLLNRSDLRFTVLGGNGAVDIIGCGG